jgi:hypothetical protein
MTRPVNRSTEPLMSLLNAGMLLALAACGLLLLTGCPKKEKDGKDGSPEANRDEESATFKGKTLAGWLAELNDKDARAEEKHADKIPRLNTFQTLGTVVPDEPNRNIGLLALAQVLEDQDKDIRELTAEAIRAYGSDAVPIFLAAIKDSKDANVRRNAAAGLSGMWNDRGWSIRRIPGGMPTRPSEEATKPAIPVLGKLLKDPTVCWCAASALIDIGKAGWPTLLKGLPEGDLQTRKAIVNVFWRTQPLCGKAVPGLIEVLKDTKNTDEELRSLLARTLGQMGDDAGEALPVLLALSKSCERDGAAADQAARNIRKIPRTTAPAMIALLKDTDLNVRSRPSMCYALSQKRTRNVWRHSWSC